MENENNLLIEIQNESNGIISEAEQINICCQEDLVFANDFLGNIKSMSKKVEEYWKDPKKRAKEAHQLICDKEKEMLLPLKDSEKIIKNKISAYNEELKRKAEEEAERIKLEKIKLVQEELAKAKEARENGNEIEANIIENNAMLIEKAEINTGNQIEKVEGLSFRKNYEIIVVDEKQVPSYINGTQIRKVDITQIKKFIKMTNNTIPIPRNCC